MKRFIGLVLLLFGSALFLLSFLGLTRTDTVIDISFVLEPGEEYGPYENGTCHHTRIFSRSTLTGEVLVAGEGIYLTANGYNTKHLKNVFINQNYSFVIDPSDDLYTFTFDNTQSNIQSTIKFTLQEKWMNSFLLIPGFVGILIMVPAGLVLLIMKLRRQPTQVKQSGR